MERRPHLAPHAAVRRPTSTLSSSDIDRLLADGMALEGLNRSLESLLHRLLPVEYYLER